MARTMKWYDWLSFWIIIIGALNWGLVQWFKFNLVDWLANLTAHWVGVVIYSLVGIAGVMGVITGIKLILKE